MKNLHQIEADYCKEIVLFFCQETYAMSRLRQYPKQEFERMLSAQIESRLLKTKLIRNYHIRYFDMPEKRDSKISGILYESYDSICDAEVILEFGFGRYANIKFDHAKAKSYT